MEVDETHGRYIVTLREKLPTRARDARRALSRPESVRELDYNVIGETSYIVVDANEEDLDVISRASNVVRIEPDVIYTPDAYAFPVPEPDDMSFCGMTNADDYGHRGLNTTVGVIDQGWDQPARDYFGGRVKAEKLLDMGDGTNDHGIMCASMAVPPDAELAIASTDYSVSQSIECINWMLDIVSVTCITMSFSGTTYVQAFQDVITKAVIDKKVKTFSSMGNAGAGGDGGDQFGKRYPAAYQHNAAIGAVDRTTGQYADFTSLGDWMWGVNSGVAVKVMGFDQVFTTANGTSFSTPLTCHQYSRLFGVSSCKGSGDVLHAMKESQFGLGVPDWEAALKSLDSGL